MITRRQMVAALATTLAAWLPAARAQGTGKIVHIGYMSTGTAESNEAFLEAFKGALRDLGYVEGRNIAIDMRFAGDNAGLFPQMAASLVKARADLIVGTCVPSTRAAKGATSTIPVVMAVDGDPVAAGLVASLAKPGGNVTGTSTSFEGLIPKWLEILHLALPNAPSIALLSNPENVVDPYFSAKFDEAAQRIGVKTVHVKSRVKTEIDAAFAELERQHAGGLVVMTEAFLAGQERRIVPLAIRYRIPAIYGYREFAEAGGLMSYGISYRDYYKRVARYVDAVLRGRKPADLPVEQPTRIELVINMKTAKALGLGIPPSLMVRADDVIR